MKESQVRYILEKEKERRYSTVLDCWYKIYTKLQATKAMPEKQILQNHSLVYSVLTSWQRVYLQIGWNEGNVLFQSLRPQADMLHPVVSSEEKSGFHWTLTSFDK